MLYNIKLRHFGWNKTNISRLRGLAWRHAIPAEKYCGPDFCCENLEYSTHTDEIKHHSSPDNYSCKLYEGAIKPHKLQKNNGKCLTKTYAKRENIRHFFEGVSAEEWTSLQVWWWKGHASFWQEILGPWLSILPESNLNCSSNCIYSPFQRPCITPNLHTIKNGKNKKQTNE